MGNENITSAELSGLTDLFLRESGLLSVVEGHRQDLTPADIANVDGLIAEQKESLDSLLKIIIESLTPLMKNIHGNSDKIRAVVEHLSFGAKVGVNGNSQEEVAMEGGDSTVASVEEAKDAEMPVASATAAIPGTDLIESTSTMPGAAATEMTTEVTNVGGAGEAAATEVPFQLSPMEDGVTVANSEAIVPEEGVVAAEQQLQTIDAMKKDIILDQTLTEQEKTAKLEQYTRITAGAVRAILVTKVQFEKLVASRDAQKGLFDGKTINVGTPAREGEVAMLPDFSATAGVTQGGGDAILPLIEGGSVEAASNASSEQVPTAPPAVLPTVEGPVEAPVAANTAPVTSQNELQLMIEQANGLYKEGKTAEAQAIFDMIGAMNNGAQTSGTTADPKVLVKQSENA